MKATSPRRQLIVAILLGLAVVGAVLRQLAPNPSLTRDVGTLLLVLWLPVIGNLVSFVITRLARRRRAAAFDPAAAFTVHVLAELTPERAAVPGLAAGERSCTLAIGTDGFTARLAIPVAQWLAGGAPAALQVEFLRPALALPRFPVGMPFAVLAGPTVAGSGCVLENVG